MTLFEPEGNALVGTFGTSEPFLEFVVKFVGLGLDGLDFVFELPGSFDRLLSLVVFSLGDQFSDLLGDLVAIVAQVVAAGFEFPPSLVDLENLVEVDVRTDSRGRRLPHRDSRAGKSGRAFAGDSLRPAKTVSEGGVSEASRNPSGTDHAGNVFRRGTLVSSMDPLEGRRRRYRSSTSP